MVMAYISLLRWRGLKALTGHWQTALLTTFGAGIFDIVLRIFQIRVSIPPTAGNNLYSWMNAAEQQLARHYGMIVLLSILSFILTYVFGVGLKNYYLQLHRGQGAGFSLLFSRMHIFGKCLGQVLLIMIFIFLWCLILVPGIFLLSLMKIYNPVVILVLVFIMLIPAIVASYRYEMASYLLADNPDMGVMQSISKSKEIMYLHKGKLFCLYVSFLGLVVLSAVIAYVLNLLLPVLGTVAGFFTSLIIQVNAHSATAAFYLELTGQTSHPDEAKQGQVA